MEHVQLEMPLRCACGAIKETLESACLGLGGEVRTRRVDLEISGMGIFILISSFSCLFIYFWLHWFFVAGHRFLQLQRCDARGFSFQWLLLLWSTSSRVPPASVVAARRLSSCSFRAQVSCTSRQILSHQGNLHVTFLKHLA